MIFLLQEYPRRYTATLAYKGPYVSFVARPAGPCRAKFQHLALLLNCWCFGVFATLRRADRLTYSPFCARHGSLPSFSPFGLVADREPSGHARASNVNGFAVALPSNGLGPIYALSLSLAPSKRSPIDCQLSPVALSRRCQARGWRRLPIPLHVIAIPGTRLGELRLPQILG